MKREYLHTRGGGGRWLEAATKGTRRIVVRDVRRAKVGAANGVGAKKSATAAAKRAAAALPPTNQDDPNALAAALSEAIQAADDPHHVRTLCEILARVKAA